MEPATTDDPIKRMIWSLGPDNKTRYPGRLKMVLDYVGLTKAGDEDYEALRIGAVEFVKMVKGNPEGVEDMLRDFITSQEQRVQNGEIKRITIRNYIKAVKTFCTMNRIARLIEWTLISKGLPSGKTFANDRAPTAEELKKLIGDDLRLKVIICIMTSCGIRVGAWNYLKVKHITPIRKGDVTLAWMVVYAEQYRGKSKQYSTLITPEAYQAFQEYLALRASAGEKITGESWVVRDIWQMTNIKRGGNYGLATIPIQLEANGVKKCIDDALWTSGIRVAPSKHHEFKECHGLRKYFKTYAQHTIKYENVEQLMGHAGHWSDAAYNRPPDDWLIDEYLKAVPDLTIYKEQEIVENQRALAAEMEAKFQEMRELKQQMAQSKQEIKDQFQAYETKMNEFVHDIQSRVYSEAERSDHNFVMDKMREILDRTAPGWFEEVYGPGAAAHRLTPKGQEKIKKLLKEITPLIEAENRQRDLELQKQREILVKTLEQG